MDLRRLLAELKARGVYQVAAVYAAGSWALLQVADLLFPILGFPEWAITAVLATAAAGFPVALVLAWLFDLVPDQGITPASAVEAGSDRLKLSPIRIAELGLLLGLVCLVGWLYLERLTLQSESEILSPASPTAVSERPSVAVMAFRNVSDDLSAEYFADGVAEEILILLASIRELNVAARAASFYFKDKSIELREIGRRLGVEHILEGSVRRFGERIRVNAQLVAVDTGFHLWSGTFDRDYDEGFRIQDEIARQVAQTLIDILSENSRAVIEQTPALVPEAYDFYLQGMDYLRRSLSKDSAESAVALFERALELDPDYANAHAGLCTAHLELYRVLRDPDEFELAHGACGKALDLRPDALRVHVALGNLHRYSGEYDKALSRFEKALTLNPNFAEALDGLGHTYRMDNKLKLAEETFAREISLQPGYWRGYQSMGGLLYLSGRFSEATPYYKRITELMPDNAEAFNDLGATYFLVGDFAQASEAWRTSIELNPTALAYANAGSSLFFQGRFRDAVELYRKAVELAPDDFANWGALGDAYYYVDDSLRDMAASMYENAIRLATEALRVNPRDGITSAFLAHYHARMNEREKAIEYMAQARALQPKEVYVHYNCALALATLGDTDAALTALQTAIDLGYSTKLVELDAGFAPLAKSPGFRLLLESQSTTDM